MSWIVDFCQDSTGNAPVERFLDSLPMQHRAKILALVAMLRTEGPTLPFPYSSQVRGRLRELRTQAGKTRLRILYFADANRTFILLLGTVKNSAKLEESDIQIAERNMADHNRRLERKK